jgi:acyl carrier protein
MDPFDDLRSIVAERFDLLPETVSVETTFQEDLGADSLDVLDLLMRVEEHFGVSIADEEATGLKTMGDAVALLHAKLAT